MGLDSDTVVLSFCDSGNAVVHADFGHVVSRYRLVGEHVFLLSPSGYCRHQLLEGRHAVCATPGNLLGVIAHYFRAAGWKVALA